MMAPPNDMPAIGASADGPSASVNHARGCLETLLRGEGLDEAAAADLLRMLAAGDLEPALAGALLVALRAKGETAEELRGFARTMRELAVTPNLSTPGAVDLVGTGGDGSGSLNLSTGAALLSAACGVPVIKHGNRSVSSRSGSSDVLTCLNPALPASPSAAADCLAATGFTFLFAQHYHPAMKAIAPVRQALKVRTIFNVMGPLTNPAAPPYCVLGAYSSEVAALMARALAGLDVTRGFVVHGEPGWDEATPCGTFELYDVRGGEVRYEVRDPAAYGIAACTAEDLAGGDADYNAARLAAALSDRDDAGEQPHREALVLGCALALEVTGRATDLGEGIAQARQVLESGTARRWLERFQAWRPATEQIR